MRRSRGVAILAAAALVLALGMAPGAQAGDCLEMCKYPLEPVCCDGKMWYNPCHMRCQFPNITFYEHCPSPPAPPPSPPSPRQPPTPPPCDPLTYPYVNKTIYSPADCRNYTLFDIEARCMPEWEAARDFCEKKGLELAPWDLDASNSSLHSLCAANRHTCWVGGKTVPGLCPLMSAEGFVLWQGCHQPVRFVCRTKGTQCLATPPSPRPPSPRPPSPKPPSPQPPSPAPSPPKPVCNPHKTTNITYFNTKDCRNYTLFDVHAVCPQEWHSAQQFCLARGLELVPHNDYAGKCALDTLCAKRGFTCWSRGPCQKDLCPLMTAHGEIHEQGCHQQLRWVCRTTEFKCPASPPSPPPPSPRPPSPKPPSPQPPSPAPSPPKPVCNPHKTTNITYFNTKDCRNYTLFDVHAVCPQEWHSAQQFCLARGLELVPHNDYAGKCALDTLCAKRGFTCWSRGPCQKDLCPLMTAHGEIHEQGCHQQLRWVCRTTEFKCPASPPSPPPPSPRPPSPKPPSPQPPSPAPSPPKPVCNPHKTTNITYFNTKDCRNYTLFDVDAVCPQEWHSAQQFCLARGLELVPHNDYAGKCALDTLCAKRGFTCWSRGPCQKELCPLMNAHGEIHEQGCHQQIRWVCRTTGRCPKPPSPKPPPMCDPHTNVYTNQSYYNHVDCRTYTVYDIDATCPVDWLTAKALCEKKGLELAPHNEYPSRCALDTLCAKRGFTCWARGPCQKDLCPLMNAHGEIHEQGCHQQIRWVCRTTKSACSPPPPSPKPPSPKPPSPKPPSPKPPSPHPTSKCTDVCDWKYPNWHVRVCDKDGNAYRNWCYAACHGCYLYTLCHAPPSLPEDKGDNVLTMHEHGYDYRMYNVDATQRMPYDQAQQFCTALGADWDLVPYDDNAGYSAVRQLCANNKYTCWFKKHVDDHLCPLIDAAGKLQLQGCEQDVRLVCRKASA
ncbi:hypothetical protein GPECTOR_45g126 [Gonium pectorale]|uniref:Kazal-like domain-containing protein n=1 Tax=Gonium pectorale TaxID=33097 RepID=A0A150G8S1_GONPE|nr:hypothetical protein GPECTOR_45g126 [Gonium pectorale]|eukprot:KXZ46256.1 hypothetical protein GPECTOR_45g126 [Gonium pectorale]